MGGAVLYNTLQTSPFGGWQYGYGYSLNLEMRPATDCNSTDDSNWKVYKLSVIFPDGSHHTLHLYPDNQINVSQGSDVYDHNGDGYYAVSPLGADSGCPEHPATPTGAFLWYYTSDGTYLQVQVDQQGFWHLYFPEAGFANGQGLGGEPMENILDKNGNQILVINTVNPNPPYDSIQTQIVDWPNYTHTITISYNPSTCLHKFTFSTP